VVTVIQVRDRPRIAEPRCSVQSQPFVAIRVANLADERHVGAKDMDNGRSLVMWRMRRRSLG